MAARFVPVNYSAKEVTAQASQQAGQQATAPPAPPTADQLSDWSAENYILDVSAAADLGFPVGALGVSTKRQVLLFGSSRSTDISGNDGNIYRFGVALRALIVVTDLNVTGALTVPIVAAKVELGYASASAQLLVRGYKGAELGGMLPSWDSFGVAAYHAYQKAVSDIQSKVTSDQANQSPELLATTALAPSLPTAVMAVSIFYALDAIARQTSLLDALKDLGNDERRLADTVRAVYKNRVGDDDSAMPDQQAAEAARKELGHLHLDHGILAGIRR